MNLPSTANSSPPTIAALMRSSGSLRAETTASIARRERSPAYSRPMPDFPRPQWIPADQNRFGVPVLDLSPITLGVIATSRDPANATRAIGWGNGVGEPLWNEVELPVIHRCELRYPADNPLPDGLLFAPSAMEEKWVIALRGDRIRAARSWTGEVQIEAIVERGERELAIVELRLPEGSLLESFGDPVEVFDWMFRAHALGEKLPMPVDDNGAEHLEAAPITAFVAFGNRVICAARGWSPPAPQQPLRSDGRVLIAARESDHDTLRSLVESGEPVDAPTTFRGYTALFLAALRDDAALAATLVDLGADPNRRADNGAVPLIVAVVHGAGVEVLDLLADRGARIDAANDDGFTALHAIAETDQPAPLAWFLARGLDLETRTRHGHTPVQIAAALGNLGALEALARAGADLEARSDAGTAADIARAQDQPEAAALIERLRESRRH